MVTEIEYKSAKYTHRMDMISLNACELTEKEKMRKIENKNAFFNKVL